MAREGAGSGVDAAGAPRPPVPAVDAILEAARAAVLARDRRYLLRTYRGVIVGTELVDWLARQPWCGGDRAAAVGVGQRLVDAGLLHHVTFDHGFRDEALFYRFRDDDTPTPRNAAERAAREYDLVVIGAGAAGLTAASFAGKLGARVALVERHRLGGDCTWTGCVPSKTLLHLARQVHTVHRAARAEADSAVRIVGGAVEVDMSAVRAHVRKVVRDVYAEETPERIAAKGVDVILGSAVFEDAHTLSITLNSGGVRRVTAEAIVVATGASPRLPALPGLERTPFHTYATIFDNDRLPRHLVVIGGGPIGCELAQAHRMLGAAVTIVAGELLPKEALSARMALERAMTDLGVRWCRGRATRVACASEGGPGTAAAPEERPGTALQVTIAPADGGAPVTLDCDMLLVATGRAPAALADLRLDAAGVVVTRDAAGTITGVPVSDGLQTNVSHIFVAGDAVGGEQFTHVAGKHGFVAARNALFPGSFTAAAVVPRCTFTEPEIAGIGLTWEQARAKHGDDVCVYRREGEHIDRSRTDGDAHALVELYVLGDGGLVGATIVGARAGEVVSEVALAMANGLKAGDIALAMHPYPAHTIGLQQVASQAASDLFVNSRVGRFVSGLYGGGPHAGAAKGAAGAVMGDGDGVGPFR